MEVSCIRLQWDPGIFGGVATAQENREFGYQFFQTGKTGNLGTTQGKFGQHREFSKFT